MKKSTIDGNLENIFVQIPTFIFWKDLHSVYLGCNFRLADHAGLRSPSEIVGKTDYEMPWADTSATFYQHGDQQVLDGVLMLNIKETILKATGEFATILTNKIPLLDKKGQKIGVIGNYTEQVDSFYYGKFDAKKQNITLTKIQCDCLFYLAKGLTAKQIASIMCVSVRTTEGHIENLKIKLKCRHKSSLIQKAWKLDFIRRRLFSE